MDILYNEMVEELLETLKNYSEDKATYEDVRNAFLKEELAFKRDSWDTTEQNIRNEIFEFQKTFYADLREVERSLKNIEKEMEGEEAKVDLNMLTSHSRMISRNKMPSEGYSNSIWYLPPCPNHNSLESLYEEETN